MDAICISSVDATGLDEKLQEAQDAGIYVSTWDSDVSPNARALMVSQGTADVLGPMLVDMAVESLKERGVDVNGEVKYVWHFSNPSVSDQNSWYVAGDKYIKEKYPSWVAVHDPYYSNQDPAQSVSVGESILDAYADVDVIICNDSTALPGQCKAAENKGLTAKDITITGFCTPSGMTSYLENGICTRWGLWDCGIRRDGLLPRRLHLRGQHREGWRQDRHPEHRHRRSAGQRRARRPVRRLLLRTTASCCCRSALSSRLRTLRITTSNPKQSLIQGGTLRGSSLCGGSCGMTRHSPLFENIYEWTIFRKED